MKQNFNYKIVLTILALFLLVPYVNAAKAVGGTITTDGLYTVHTFTTNTTFNVSDATLTSVEVLVVAGGGGGSGSRGSGGGAGGLLYNQTYALTENVPVIIGTGGAGTATGTISSIWDAMPWNWYK